MTISVRFLCCSSLLVCWLLQMCCLVLSSFVPHYFVFRCLEKAERWREGSICRTLTIYFSVACAARFSNCRQCRPNFLMRCCGLLLHWFQIANEPSTLCMWLYVLWWCFIQMTIRLPFQCGSCFVVLLCSVCWLLRMCCCFVIVCSFSLLL